MLEVHHQKKKKPWQGQLQERKTERQVIHESKLKKFKKTKYQQTKSRLQKNILHNIYITLYYLNWVYYFLCILQ